LSRKLDARELLAALGGLLVLISLFLDWFERDGRGAEGTLLPGDFSVTGWQVFESLDLVLAALAVLAIATGAAALGTVAALGPRSLLPLGLVLLMIVVVQLVSQPPAAWGSDPTTGAWMALGGSLLVVLGGALSAARIDITVNVGPRDTRRRVPAVDRRPSAPSAPSAPSEPSAPPAATPSPSARAGSTAAPAAADPQATQPFKPVDGGT
jgi:hypothetical protein